MSTEEIPTNENIFISFSSSNGLLIILTVIEVNASHAVWVEISLFCLWTIHVLNFLRAQHTHTHAHQHTLVRAQIRKHRWTEEILTHHSNHSSANSKLTE